MSGGEPIDGSGILAIFYFKINIIDPYGISNKKWDNNFANNKEK